MKLSKEEVKIFYSKLSDKFEKIGLKLNVSLLIYTIILCVITVNLDRGYIKWKIERAANKAFEQMGNPFDNKDIKKKKKKKFFAPKPQEITLGTLIKTDTFEITVQKAGFINKLVPPHIKEWSYYTYYEAKDKENMLIDMVVNVKNLDTAEINTENILPEVKALYDTKYEYTGYSTVEQSDGADFESSSTINPLQTRKIHYLIEIPKISKSDNAPVDIIFDINDKTYTLPIKVQKETVSQQEVVIPQNNIQNKNSEIKQEVQKVDTSKEKITTKPKNKPEKQKKVDTNKPNSKPAKSNKDMAKELLFN